MDNFVMNNVDKLRKEKKISIEKFSEQTDILTRTYYRYKKEEPHILSNIRKFAEVLQVSLDQLFVDPESDDLNPNPDDSAILKEWGDMDGKQKEMLLAFAQLLKGYDINGIKKS